jgi:ABC-type uncharacterized transport system ATPase subunit
MSERVRSWGGGIARLRLPAPPLEAERTPADTIPLGRGRTVRMRAITKRFGVLVANDEVEFDVRPAEIHALVGENGAGKTTLMRILYGMLLPDSGEITVDGQPTRIRSPKDALSLGIGMVHQHFMLVPDMRVWENIVLGTAVSPVARVQPARLAGVAARALEMLGSSVSPAEVVQNLPVDLQQQVEIARLLYRGARTLLLDEPTAALGPRQSERLFAALDGLRQRGCAVVIVTHKLAEVLDHTDRVTVMRRGKVVARAKSRELTQQQLATAMLGEGFVASPRISASEALATDVAEIRDLKAIGANGKIALDGVTLTIRSHRILGVIGVEGNGQEEFMQTVAGLVRSSSGEIYLNGQDISRSSVRARDRMGVASISGDRLKYDIVPELSTAENLYLHRLSMRSSSWAGFVSRRAMFSEAAQVLKDFDIQPANPRLRAGQLSGGNQQKLVVARELLKKPQLLLAANPTRGLDVGAAEAVRNRLSQARDDGAAVVLSSSDVDEVLELADEVIVLFRGTVWLAGSTATTDRSSIANAMAGLSPAGS